MSSTVNFGGRVVIVTGAGNGMGRSHAKVLASRGARVVVNDIRNAADVVAEIGAQDGEAVPDEHDIATEEGAVGLVHAAVSAFGRVDAIVNNAGISTDDPFPEISWELFDRIQKVNTYGPFFITKHAWPHLIRSGSGRVVMVASKSALRGGPPNRTHYAASKGAVLAMTRRLAYDGLDHGIRVNAVLPTALTSMLTQGSDGREVQNPLVPRMAEQFGVDVSDGPRLEALSVAAVSSVVAWLCHSDCTSTGEFFNTVAGEVSRLTYAMGPGINDPGLTVETVRDRFETIMDMTGAAMLQAR